MTPIEFSIILPYFERPAQLRATLLSFANLYSGRPLEVIVVDDASSPTLRPSIPEGLGFPVKVVTLKVKNGINPCLPYNIGARHANGSVLILSSPETCHVRDIFVSEVWQTFSENDYLLFQVFAATDQGLNERFTAAKTLSDIRSACEQVLANQDSLTSPLGFRGYAHASASGSWYCHPVHRKTGLNFLSAIHKVTFEQMQGFDERFRVGTGYDDLEFRDRLVKRQTFHYSEQLIGIHLEHEVVANKAEFQKPINSNQRLYFWAKLFGKPKLSSWGRADVTLENF